MKIAIPKGRLQERVITLLAMSGINVHFRSENDYNPIASDAEVMLCVKKPRAIPQLVSLGIYDLGFVGLDIVCENDYEDVKVLCELGYNPVDLVVATSRGNADILKHPPQRPIRIATEYENLADRWAMKHRLAHITIQTFGSTEGYALEDADIIFDCRETGVTIADNQLVVLDTIVKSSTVLIGNKKSPQDHTQAKKIRG